jgi:hypothetical protein
MDPGSPLLSIVVMTHGISRQAKNTLETLAPSFQRNVAASDYEVVVVERVSGDLLGEDTVRAVLPAAHYVLSDGEGSLGAIASLGIQRTRAPFVGLLFDAATMVTPRLVEHALLGTRAYESPIVAVPAYQLGKEPQHLHGATGYDERAEMDLLATVDWKRDGHELFEISCRDPAFQNGFLAAFSELGCVFSSRACLESCLPDDERLDTEGALSLYVFGSLCLVPGTKLVVLASEGTFHQFHACPSTLDALGRKAATRTLRQSLLGAVPPPREPTLLGAFPGQAMLPLLAASHDAVMFRNFCDRLGGTPYASDAS